jgi:hypothetical protein
VAGIFQPNLFQNEAGSVGLKLFQVDVVVPPSAGGGAAGVGGRAWREYYKGKNRKKKEALSELDELIAALRTNIVLAPSPSQEDELREALERCNAIDMSDTVRRIETEIERTKELLAEIDDEEAVFALLV